MGRCSSEVCAVSPGFSDGNAGDTEVLLESASRGDDREQGDSILGSKAFGVKAFDLESLCGQLGSLTKVFPENNFLISFVSVDSFLMPLLKSGSSKLLEATDSSVELVSAFTNQSSETFSGMAGSRMFTFWFSSASTSLCGVVFEHLLSLSDVSAGPDFSSVFSFFPTFESARVFLLPIARKSIQFCYGNNLVFFPEEISSLSLFGDYIYCFDPILDTLGVKMPW